MTHTQLPWKSDFEFSEDYYHAGYSIDGGNPETNRGIYLSVATDIGEIEDVKFILQACNNYYKYHAAMEEARRLIVEELHFSDRRNCILEMLNDALGIKWRKWDIAVMVAQSEQIKKDHPDLPPETTQRGTPGK